MEKIQEIRGKSISNDGTIVAIGAPFNSSSGHVRVYALTNPCSDQGCLDPLALNFDPYATIDDSSCVYPIYGCIDTLAINYNLFINISISSCIYCYSFSDTIIVSSCDFYLWDGVTYDSTGFYTNIYSDVNGCDSTIALDLTVTNSTNRIDSITICEGSNFIVGTNIYDSTGNYIDTLLTVNGCDSIINTVLNVVNTSIEQNDTTICVGNSVSLEVSGNFINSQSVCNLDELPLNLHGGLVAYYPFLWKC